MISHITAIIDKLALLAKGVDPESKKQYAETSDINSKHIKDLLNAALEALNITDQAKTVAKIEKNKSAGLPAHHGLPWTEKEVNWLKQAFSRINGKIPAAWLEEKLKRKQGAIIKKCVEEKIIPFLHAIDDYVQMDETVKNMLLKAQ